MSDANVIDGPWAKRETRRPLSHLVNLGPAVDIATNKPKVHPDLLKSLGAKMECFAALAKSLADESKSVQRVEDAAILMHVASLMETRSAAIEVDLELFV